MKKIFTLLAITWSVAAFAQNVKITGTVVDSTSTKPVEFATVALMDPASGKAIDGTICDDKGEFTLSKVAVGNYDLTITFIGFDTKTIKLAVEDRKEINLGKIIIKPTAQVLKEVTVEGQRALIEERVDRTVYNAENDQTTKGGDATDVLQRVPLLTVDMDGNVSLRGNQNITVLINNKPSTIMASSVADALKQIPADQIKTVEVITSPSAKYDAEGSAGIINIVTKKNTLEGLTLNVDAGVGLRGSNLGLNGNFRRGKLGLSLGGWGRANYNVNGSFENTQIGNGNTNFQRADTRSNGMFGRYNLGLDYDINEKNFITGSVRFGLRNGENYQDDLQRSLNGSLISFSDNISDDQATSIDASLTFTHLSGKPQREWSFQALYSRDNRDNIFENIDYSIADRTTIEERLRNLNESVNQEMTLQFDYQTPVRDNQMLEFGAKNIMRSAVSDFATFSADGNGSFVRDESVRNSNNLNYDQNVTAGYLSYTYAAKSGYTIKAGSRYEYTTINAYTLSENNIDIPSYGIIVPSVNLSKKLKGGNMVKASYNRRIQRPSIRFLNPNKQFSNTINYTIGNPSLDPEYTNNYELSYNTFVKGVTLNVSTFLRNTNDAIQSVRTLESDTLVTRFANIGKEDAYGGSLFANVTLGKLTLSGGGDVFYASLDNSNPNPEDRLKNAGWVASGRIFGSYDLGKDWGFQFFSFVRGRQVQLQGTQGGFYMYSLSLRKQFNEKRGSIGLGAENFLQSGIRIRTELESPDLIQRGLNVRNNLSFRLNFSYRIGKMSMDSRPRGRRSINNDDLKEGDGGGGDMQMGGGDAGRGNNAMPMMGGQRPQGQTIQRPAVAQQTLPQSNDSTIHEAAGTWSFTLDSPQGGAGTIVIKKENDIYSGTIKTERMPQETPFTSVVVNGNEITMSYTASFGGNSVPVEIKTVITSASDMQGTMAFGQFRTLNLTGKKSN